MKPIAAFTLAFAVVNSSEPRLPLASGDYVFQHRFAEQPALQSISLDARIRGHHIVLVNPKASDPFPAGVIAEGDLVWHAATHQWIIVESELDRSTEEVGGCGDGPEVIDLEARVYWTC